MTDYIANLILPVCDSKGQAVVPFKYDEEKIIKEVYDYITNTYSEHYVGGNNIQAFDVWDALGSAETSHRDTAIKYLFRYGKKNGFNRADLLKATHYCILLLYYNSKRENGNKSASG